MYQVIRCLFGTSDRRVKVGDDIQRLKKVKYPLDSICYTYGKDNHQYLIDNNIKSVLLCDEDMMFADDQYWAHKLYVWQVASKTYDKFFYIDWDVLLMRPLPNTIGHLLKGKKFLASLRCYVNQKVTWRNDHKRKVPCASFMYFTKNIADELYNLWIDMGKPRKEELVLAKYTELDGKLDLDYYYNMYEPKDLFILKNHTPFKDVKGVNLDTYYRHFNGRIYE